MVLHKNIRIIKWFNFFGVTVLIITPLSPFIMASMSILHGMSYVSENALQHKEFTNDQRATMASVISLGASLC